MNSSDETTMLIREKRPQGSLYPQITQAPTNYFDFLNYFRGGHTIDNNLTAGVIAISTQANLLKSAIKRPSGNNDEDRILDSTLGEAEVYA